MKNRIWFYFITGSFIVQTFLFGSVPSRTVTHIETNPVVERRKETLEELYGWTVVGEWSEEEINVLFKAAWNLQKYVEVETGEDGQAWIRNHLGNVRFHHETPVNRILFVNYALPTRDIYLLNDYGRSKDPERDVTHELAHLLDNSLGGLLPASIVGGGPADKMVSAVGGDPGRCSLRAYCPRAYSERASGPESWPEHAYANKGVAEDFAETLVFSIYDRSQVPARRLEWMDEFIARGVE